MKNILITGSEGNIGAYLVRHLQNFAPDVAVIRVKRKESPGEPEKMGNLYIGDLSDRSFVEKIFRENTVDYVIHLAARSYNLNDIEKSAYQIYGNDVMCLLNVLNVCRSIKKFIYFSSALIYESSPETIFSEELTERILPPKSSLGLAKYSGEKAVEFFGKQYGVPYTIWRPFNIVSPLESHERKGGHVFVDFYRKIYIEHSPKIQIFGSGKQVKCFLWVEDLVSAVSDFLDNKKTDNQIFNIAGTEQKTLMDLAETLLSIGKKKNILPKDYHPQIIAENEFLKERQKIPSVEKIKNILGWEPQTSFQDCFSKFIEFKSS